MTFSSFLSYLRAFFPRLPMIHWIVIAGVSLVVLVFLLIRKKNSVYGSFILALTVLYGLFLLDDLFLCRLGGDIVRPYGFDLGAEYQRLVNGSVEHRILMFFNVAFFVPFGFFLSEFFLVVKQGGFKRCLGFVVTVAFVFSFVIESLQLVFRVGIFELTDLVMNTLGAAIGGGVSLALNANRTISHP